MKPWDWEITNGASFGLVIVFELRLESEKILLPVAFLPIHDEIKASLLEFQGLIYKLSEAD